MARVHLFSASSPHHEKGSHDSMDVSFAHLSQSNEAPVLIAQDDSHTLDITAVPSPDSQTDHAQHSSPLPQPDTHEPVSQPSPGTTASSSSPSLANSTTLSVALLQNATTLTTPETLDLLRGQQDTAHPTKDSETKTDMMDQEAAATALQLLGLSHNENKDTPNKDQKDQLDDNVMLVVDYPGLTDSSASDSMDLTGEDSLEGYKRGTWTDEEDESLLAGIRKFGYGRWKEIASTIPGRKGKQLKQRWDNTLGAKYVDQDWLKNKIRSDEESQAQLLSTRTDTPMAESPSAPESPSQSHVHTDEESKTADEKTLKLLETTAWNQIAQKITEKAREGDQEALEALISQALLGTAAATSSSSSSVAPSPSSSSSAIADTSTPSSVPFDHNSVPLLNFADAAALSLYAQQLQQGDHNAASHPYFLPTSCTGETNNAVAVAAAVAAVASASAANHGIQLTPSPGVAPAPRADSAKHKRKRSDPALADTQSAAMSIYASSAPITTTIDNHTQTVFPCLFPNCGKAFGRLYNLKSHSRTHTDDRPFICDMCDMAFSRNHDLKRHSKIHGGNKPYVCRGCTRSFSRLDALKRHQVNPRNKTPCMDACMDA